MHKKSSFIVIIKGEIAIPITELPKSIKYECIFLIIFILAKEINVFIIIKINTHIIDILSFIINSIKQIIIKIK
jgi:hypothetical protein